MQFKMSFKCLKKSTSTQQSPHYRKMNSISMAMDESCKWQRTETDNRSNIAPPCHQCFHILCPRAVSECFFILFPPPAHTHSTSSLLRALESNFLLIKFTIKAPLMPTWATLPFWGFFPAPSIDFFMSNMKCCLPQKENLQSLLLFLDRCKWCCAIGWFQIWNSFKGLQHLFSSPFLKMSISAE